MLSDIEIAENCKLKDIREIAKKLSLDEDSLEPYGKYKAKINLIKIKPHSKLDTCHGYQPDGERRGENYGFHRACRRYGKT